MSAATGTERASLPSELTGFVRRHPVAVFLLAAHAGLWGCIGVVLLLGAPPRPLSSLGAILGLAVPALLITAATEGRPGVRDLLARTVHWRVGVPWYLFAIFAVPVGALVLAPLFAGSAAVEALGQDWVLVFSEFLPMLLLGLVTVQLFEEFAWSGFAQHRVQASRGAMKAALLLGLAFATVHFPMYLIGLPLTVKNVIGVVGLQLVVIPMALCIRVLFAWVYNRTGFSILLAAILHASFNAANSPGFLPQFVSGGVASMLPLAVVVLLAIAVAVATKGQLGYRPRPLDEAAA